MVDTRLIYSGTADAFPPVNNADSAAEHDGTGTGLGVLMAAAVRDGDDAALSELKEIESALSRESCIRAAKSAFTA